MLTPRWLRRSCLAITLGWFGSGSLGSLPCVAQSSPVSALDQALRTTQETGRPTVAVSPRLFAALSRLPSVRDLSDSLQLVCLPTTPDPKQARWLGKTSESEVRVYARGERGPEQVARLARAKDEFDAIAWLQTVTGRLTTTTTKADAPRDPELIRTHGFHHQQAQPSPQGYVPAPAPQMQVPAAVPQVQVPAAVPAMVPVATSAPASIVSTPAAQPVVVQTASTPIVVQQAPPTIYVAQPSQPANIQILASAPAAPSVSILQPASVATVAQPSQLFLASTPAAAPAAVASVPATYAPAAMPVQVAAAPVQVAAAPAQVAAAPAANAIAGIPAGPIGRLIGNLGEKMVKHKYPRVPVASTAATTAIAAAPAAVAQPATVPLQYVSVPAGVPQAAYLPAGIPAQNVISSMPYQPAPSPQGGVTHFGLSKHGH